MGYEDPLFRLAANRFDRQFVCFMLDLYDSQGVTMYFQVITLS